MNGKEAYMQEVFNCCIKHKEDHKDFVFVSKDSHLHKPYSKEDGYYVFLEVLPKTDKFTYVKELSSYFSTILFRNMEEQKEVKIQIPEGYEIDCEKSTFEKIIFKKKENPVSIYPKSWEEFAAIYKGKPCFALVDGEVVKYTYDESLFYSFDIYKDALPTKELAESVLALIQLLSLRKAWVGDWEPNWTKGPSNFQYCIVKRENTYSINDRFSLHTTLSFPTRELAWEFLYTFSDLIEKAGDLI